MGPCMAVGARFPLAGKLLFAWEFGEIGLVSSFLVEDVREESRRGTLRACATKDFRPRLVQPPRTMRTCALQYRDGMRRLVIQGSELNFPERASPRAAVCGTMPKIFPGGNERIDDEP